MSRVVVIGVGNPYRRDDGVGPAVVVRLRQLSSTDEVDLIESDGEPSQLLAGWDGATCAMVVDAIRTAVGQPGRVHRRCLHHPGFANGGLARTASASSHAVDLGEAVALGQALGRLPQTLLLYGVEVADTSFGVGLSDAVAKAAADLAGEIAAEIAGR